MRVGTRVGEHVGATIDSPAPHTSGEVTVRAPQYRVGNVTEGSDASRQGVMRDAMLVAINGRQAGGVSMKTVKALLVARAGTSANLVLLSPDPAAPAVITMDVVYDCAVPAADAVYVPPEETHAESMACAGFSVRGDAQSPGRHIAYFIANVSAGSDASLKRLEAGQRLLSINGQVLCVCLCVCA